jgi:hypothetical protein
VTTIRRLFLLPLLVLLPPAGWTAETPKTVPPEGVAPFDPKPLMTKVEERVKEDKYRFAVVGDSKHAKSFPALLQYLDKELKPDFVLSTGDLVRTGGGKPGPAEWGTLAKEGDDAFRARPWWPVVGNHEISGTPAKKTAHDDDAELPENEAGSADGKENFKRFYNLEKDYYSFTFRNAVFIALPFPWPKDESEQWLTEELKKASAAKKRIFVYNHNPFFTVGSKTKKDYPNKENDITKLFSEQGVCAVFSGHEHIYYRTIRGGVPYIISAGGGATLYALTRKSEALPEDVYYGIDPGSLPKKKYYYHNGAGGGPDRLADQPDQYAVVVDVNGPKVTMRTVTAKGEKWDELTLAK